MNQPTDAQMAAATRELLQTAHVPFAKLDMAVAVHNWLEGKSRPQEVPTMQPQPPFSERQEASNE